MQKILSQALWTWLATIIRYRSPVECILQLMVYYMITVGMQYFQYTVASGHQPQHRAAEHQASHERGRTSVPS